MSTGKKVCLITGATGFVGQYLTKYLYERGQYVVCLSWQEHAPKNLYGLYNEWHVYDFAKDSPEDLNFKKNIDHFYHLSATVSETQDLNQLKERYISDIVGPINLIDSLKEKIAYMCFFSSTSVYNVRGVYSLSKSMLEDALRMTTKRYNIPFSCLRISSVYGPGMPEKAAIYRFIDDLKSGKRPSIGCDKHCKRNYIFIKDIAPAAFEIVYKNLTGDFNIASRESVDIIKVINTICAHLNVKTDSIFYDAEKQIDTIVDISRAAGEINFQPTGLECGIGETIECMS